MADIQVRDFLKKVSGAEIYADFTDFDNTKMNPMGYGMYDVRYSPVGPFMILYRYAPTNIDSTVTMIEVRTQDTDMDSLVFVDSVLDAGKEVDSDFVALRKFIGSLKSRPSTMSYNKAYDKFFYFLTDPGIREANAEKYRHAEVFYDTINKMGAMGSQNTKLVKNKNGYDVRVRFPNNKFEEMTFQFVDHYDEFGSYPSVTIGIPRLDLFDTFLSQKHDEYKHEMIFNHAKKYIDSVKSGEPFVLGKEPLDLFEAKTKHLMSLITNSRQSIK